MNSIGYNAGLGKFIQTIIIWFTYLKHFYYLTISYNFDVYNQKAHGRLGIKQKRGQNLGKM